MKIGIIGSGNVGGTLGTRWAKGGHQVVFGSRHPDAGDMQQLLTRAGSNARAATLQEAVKSCDVLLLATPWPATKEIVQGLGDFTGKVLIDAVNPLLPDLSGLALGSTTSAAEQVACWARGAKVVKAFNTIGPNIMENADSARISQCCSTAVTTQARRATSNNWRENLVSTASMPVRLLRPACSKHSRCYGFRWHSRRGSAASSRSNFCGADPSALRLRRIELDLFEDICLAVEFGLAGRELVDL